MIGVLGIAVGAWLNPTLPADSSASTRSEANEQIGLARSYLSIKVVESSLRVNEKFWRFDEEQVSLGDQETSLFDVTFFNSKEEPISILDATLEVVSCVEQPFDVSQTNALSFPDDFLDDRTAIRIADVSSGAQLPIPMSELQVPAKGRITQALWVQDHTSWGSWDRSRHRILRAVIDIHYTTDEGSHLSSGPLLVTLHPDGRLFLYSNEFIDGQLGVSP